VLAAYDPNQNPPAILDKLAANALGAATRPNPLLPFQGPPGIQTIEVEAKPL
jgi:hypothetical protein